MITAVSAAPGVMVGFFIWAAQVGDAEQQILGDQSFSFCARADGRMKQVFPALPTADKIAVLALCEVLPVVHSDVVKVVQTDDEVFLKIERQLSSESWDFTAVDEQEEWKIRLKILSLKRMKALQVKNVLNITAKALNFKL